MFTINLLKAFHHQSWSQQWVSQQCSPNLNSLIPRFLILRLPTPKRSQQTRKQFENLKSTNPHLPPSNPFSTVKPFSFFSFNRYCHAPIPTWHLDLCSRDELSWQLHLEEESECSHNGLRARFEAAVDQLSYYLATVDICEYKVYELECNVVIEE